MFTKIQHVGYHVHDLEQAVAWFAEKFGGQSVAQGTPNAGGRSAFVRFGGIEVALAEPPNKTEITPDTLQPHHVGYVVPDIAAAARQLQGKGLKFISDQPSTNALFQQVLWIDPATTNDARIHLVQLPHQPDTAGYGQGLDIERIIHAGYVVEDLDAAVAWYQDILGGEYIGGGMSRRGVNNAFVNFGQVQVELLEPNSPDQLDGRRHNIDHVGYVVSDIVSGIHACESRGLTLGEAGPRLNTINQQLCYFDTECTLGTQIHLTQLPD